jgi:hypothetical protein
MLDNLKIFQAETLYIEGRVIQLWQIHYRVELDQAEYFKQMKFKRGEVRLIRGDNQYELFEMARLLHKYGIVEKYQLVSYFDLVYEKEEEDKEVEYLNTLGFSKYFDGDALFDEERLPFLMKGQKAYAYASAEGYPSYETVKEHQIKLLGVKNLEEYIITA